MSRIEAKQQLRHRVEEVSREMGLLVLVFVPIDFVLAEDTPRHRAVLLIFVAIGLLLLVGSIVAEYRRLCAD
jgi:hypothetical protein